MPALKPPAEDELVRSISAEDEFNHQPHGDATWRENCWLTFFDARSELRAEFREKQCGGGWVPLKTRARISR